MGSLNLIQQGPYRTDTGSKTQADTDKVNPGRYCRKNIGNEIHTFGVLSRKNLSKSIKNQERHCQSNKGPLAHLYCKIGYMAIAIEAPFKLYLHIFRQIQIS